MTSGGTSRNPVRVRSFRRDIGAVVACEEGPAVRVPVGDSKGLMSIAPARSLVRRDTGRRSRFTFRSALEEQCALALVSRERGRALELCPGLLEAAELHEEV